MSACVCRVRAAVPHQLIDPLGRRYRPSDAFESIFFTLCQIRESAWRGQNAGRGGRGKFWQKESQSSLRLTAPHGLGALFNRPRWVATNQTKTASGQGEWGQRGAARVSNPSQ
jgi:hypothetical protein